MRWKAEAGRWEVKRTFYALSIRGAVLIGIVVVAACNKVPTALEPTLPLKDPRTYTWTVDTLAATTMQDIWGSSTRDVYVVGHNSLFQGGMYHYDGHRWRAGYSPFGDVTLEAIHGFAANDVWVVGSRWYTNPTPPPNFLEKSLVLHYDGTGWRELHIVKRGGGLSSIWGSSPNDIWMGGLDATLYHYDGTSIKRDSIPFPIPQTGHLDSYDLASIAGSSRSVHLLLVVLKAPLYGYQGYFFDRASSGWTLVDSVFYSPRYDLWVSPSNTLYAVGHGVYRRVGGSWLTLHLDNAIAWISIGGTSDDNFFVVGRSVKGGEVYHYNGTDWFQFKELQFADAFYNGVWTDGRETFIVGLIEGGTIVVHGK